MKIKNESVIGAPRLRPCVKKNQQKMWVKLRMVLSKYQNGTRLQDIDDTLLIVPCLLFKVLFF
ncbi:MAG: hypothetical protein A2504_14970 [Bdellovibrionales bacterium RIFOXYD12_FULL_39_22]|nr:MAG: hypothetical protein A2385_02400 [Bdellovibrionales bacterium RIFOXYB1_FULL_39_21]OFZ47835.1 MAG: hypothetical protein A2404_16185 [Bdellovibrionales bacterium RIFOXYC1_FULL_39_130]OFZ75615.1 MAG: hypothetical protein A2560_12685 [Bdellovibrionales bacterium RIFOXYD1_FULL_39_84]OFZ94105.1 MAG: hypothetical protein A2504_14970 [Bdellovibrionales bacterium RIFOXYD12_FULL_39_22]